MFIFSFKDNDNKNLLSSFEYFIKIDEKLNIEYAQMK